MCASRSNVLGKPFKLRRRNPKHDTYLADPFLMSPLHFQCQVLNELALAIRIIIIFGSQDKRYQIPFKVWSESKQKLLTIDPLDASTTEAKDLICLVKHMRDTKSKFRFLEAYSVLLKFPEHKLHQQLSYFLECVDFLSHPQRLAPYNLVRKKSREVQAEEQTIELIDVSIHFVDQIKRVISDPGLDCAKDNLKNIQTTFLSYLQYKRKLVVDDFSEDIDHQRNIALKLAQSLIEQLQNDRSGELSRTVIELIQPRLLLRTVSAVHYMDDEDADDIVSSSDEGEFSDTASIGYLKSHSGYRDSHSLLDDSSVQELTNTFKPAKTEHRKISSDK